MARSASSCAAVPPCSPSPCNGRPSLTGVFGRPDAPQGPLGENLARPAPRSTLPGILPVSPDQRFCRATGRPAGFPCGCGGPVLAVGLARIFSQRFDSGDLVPKLEERSRLRGGFSSGEGCDGRAGIFWTKTLDLCMRRQSSPTRRSFYTCQGFFVAGFSRWELPGPFRRRVTEPNKIRSGHTRCSIARAPAARSRLLAQPLHSFSRIVPAVARASSSVAAQRPEPFQQQVPKRRQPQRSWLLATIVSTHASACKSSTCCLSTFSISPRAKYPSS